MNVVTKKPADARATRPLRADAARNQQRILAAARDLFADRGLEITLDDVAERAGVGVGTVYRRFSNKQELIGGVFEENVERMAEQAELALDQPDPWRGLVNFFEYMCMNMAANRGLGEVLVGLEDGQERFACVKERMQPAIARVIDRARDAGELRPDAAPEDFFAVVNMVDWVADFSRPVNPDVWRRYFALLLDGLRADAKKREPLPVPPLTDDEIHQAKMACFNKRR
ncbi:TetR/AcrR family transcriptional regulator [Antrihabitans sp. YC2-6]|uniref:TetR/AcrR family transcriptional regulator n=1 Tax=Antrihabitans sp. YC2-6 TaxID=2799498 RepID=UPI0027DD0760|nr:TetR/AcrR family transcriptional regulator [Antrihabitans sp. YC2-6]